MSAVYLSTKLKSDVMIVTFFFRCDDYDVPDTMNVHGIYDKKSQYGYVWEPLRVSDLSLTGSWYTRHIFGFYACVKSA